LFAVVAPLWVVGCDKASPPAAATGAGTDAPTGYTVVVSTQTGKSLITQKSNVTTVQAALLATFPELAAFFGSRPTIGSAFQDAHDPTTGGATFSSTFNGQPIRGIVSCKVHDGGASVAVIFGRTDAPKADWEKLMSPPAAQAGAAGAGATPGSQSAVPGVSLKEYNFPDGTCSVELADGWTTNCQSVLAPCIIRGPGDQIIVIQQYNNINTPDSPLVLQRQKQEAANANAQANANGARWGIPPIHYPALPPLLVGTMSDPVTVLQNIIPQLSKLSDFNKAGTMTLDKIISSTDAPSDVKGGKRAIIKFDFTKTLNGKSTAYRELVDLTVYPSLNNDPTQWVMLSQPFMSSPVDSFDHDLPLMMAMARSFKSNPERVQQVVEARINAMQQQTHQMAIDQQNQQNARFQQFQADQQRRYDEHNEQMAVTQAGYDAHNQQFYDYELQRSRHAADFNESILGTRTVYDTVTGQSGYANLTDVNGVVDSLNQAALDPNRFVQIPLRDQLYPLPPGK
jgi:hypothetical protein